jgi:hypothetical protein
LNQFEAEADHGRGSGMTETFTYVGITALMISVLVILRVRRRNSDPVQKHLANLFVDVAREDASYIHINKFLYEQNISPSQVRWRIPHALSMARPVMSEREFDTASIIGRSIATTYTKT